MEVGETPFGALIREVKEETGYLVEPGYLIGAYSSPLFDDLVLSMMAMPVAREAWCANEEIAEVGYYPVDALPEPFSVHARRRIEDALTGRKGIVHIFHNSPPPKVS